MFKVLIPADNRENHTRESGNASISGQWLADRCGKLTASNMWKAIDVLKNGMPSAAQKDLIDTIVSERLSGFCESNFVTPAMQWGKSMEPEARELAETACGLNVVGDGQIFVDHPTIEYFGASPDGFVGFDSLIEIKCPTTKKFVSWVRAGVVPDEHKSQMLAQLACTKRRRVHFFAYDPRVKTPKKYLHLIYEPARNEIEEIEEKAIDFLARVDAEFEKATLALC
jgi:putative phage-type endonuclease